MAEPSIRFDDGAAYEQMMGRWSALVGERFLDWLDVPPGRRWLDVGCGNGAFTHLILERCAPSQVQAFDPSPAQLAYARSRMPPDAPVRFAEGHALQMPVADASCDVAVMALVLFFVTDPARGIAEMCRAVGGGGTVAAYHWDVLGGGFPLTPIAEEMRAMGTPPQMPPSAQASTLESSDALWRAAGLREVRTAAFTVERRFESFDDYWSGAAHSNTLRPMFEAKPREEIAELKRRVRARLRAGDGPLVLSARANAVSGIKP